MLLPDKSNLPAAPVYVIEPEPIFAEIALDVDELVSDSELNETVVPLIPTLPLPVEMVSEPLPVRMVPLKIAVPDAPLPPVWPLIHPPPPPEPNPVADVASTTYP